MKVQIDLDEISEGKETETDSNSDSEGSGKRKAVVKQVSIKKTVGKRMKQYEIVHKVAKAVQEINMNELKQQKKDYNQKLKEIFIESLNSTHNFHVMRDNFKIIESVL